MSFAKFINNVVDALARKGQQSPSVSQPTSAIQTLGQRTLRDGSTLTLERYQLDQVEAEALGRPVGSHEITLTFRARYGGGTTPPKASWYIGEGEFRRLYDQIRNEDDFRKVQRFLGDEVRSSEDANKVGSFLEKL